MISLFAVICVASVSTVNCYAGSIPPKPSQPAQPASQPVAQDEWGDVTYSPAQAVQESSMSQWWWIGAALVAVGIVVAVVAATSGSSSRSSVNVNP